MTDRLLTPRDLLAPGPRPGLYELRVLDRSLRGRLAELDARVDELLALDARPTDAQVGAVDVLCAAIAEVRELLDEARHEAAAVTLHQRARRATPRRWS